MEMEGLDDVYRFQRFVPTPEEAVGYFLRRLLTGETLHGAEKLIRHAAVYACEPKDLARQFAPVPTAVSSGDRFFFTTLRRNKNGQFARGAGAGTWTIQKTEDVYDEEGVKIGEERKLSFKKDKKSTGWVMEEYRCLLPQAVVADGEMVLCRIHLAPHPPAAARQESDAYKLRRQERAEPTPAPQPEPASAHAQKRPAPVAAADLPCSKKMRMAAPVPVPVPEPETEYEDCPVWFTPPAAPVSTSPAASTEMPEADDDPGRLSCSWEDLFGEEQQEEQILPVEAENMVRLVSDQDIDQFVQSLLAVDSEPEIQEEEQTTLPVEAQNNNIQQLDFDEDIDIAQLEAPIDWECLLAQIREDEAEHEKRNRCNHGADLQGQHNQFFSFSAVN